jgi:hypothetical protein
MKINKDMALDTDKVTDLENDLKVHMHEIL